MNSVGWDPTGNFIVSGGSDSLVKVWNFSSRPVFKKIAFAPTSAIDFSQLTDKTRVGVIVRSDDTKVLDLKSLAIEDVRAKASVFDVRTIAQDADVEALIRTANLELRNQQADLFDEPMQSVDATVESKRSQVFWSPDRTRVALQIEGLGRFKIQVWSTETQKRISEWELGWSDRNIKKYDIKWTSFVSNRHNALRTGDYGPVGVTVGIAVKAD